MTNPFKFIAIFLIVGVVALLIMIYGPILNEEINYQTLNNQDKNEIEKTKTTPLSAEFGLVIPKIGINSEVFPKISVENKDEYLPVLKEGVAHAKGSVFPGEDGNVFIFAHSTDSPLRITKYNSEYYLLSKLKKEDGIIVYYEKRKYTYEVTEKKTIPPEVVIDYLRSGTERNLVIQTTHPPGTTLNRLLVIAKEVI